MLKFNKIFMFLILVFCSRVVFAQVRQLGYFPDEKAKTISVSYIDGADLSRYEIKEKGFLIIANDSDSNLIEGAFFEETKMEKKTAFVLLKIPRDINLLRYLVFSVFKLKIDGKVLVAKNCLDRSTLGFNDLNIYPKILECQINGFVFNEWLCLDDAFLKEFQCISNLDQAYKKIFNCKTYNSDAYLYECCIRGIELRLGVSDLRIACLRNAIAEYKEQFGGIRRDCH